MADTDSTFEIQQDDMNRIIQNTTLQSEKLFPDSIMMVACDQCSEATPWPLRCGHDHVEVYSREYSRSRAPVVAPQGDSESKAKEIVEEYKQRVMQLPSGDAVPCAKWLETRLRIAFDLVSPASSPVDNDSCPHWREGDSDNCVLCGDDLGPTTEADVTTPAATPTPVEQEQVQCADCLAWINRDANHTCRQQVRRNQRSTK